MLFLVLLSSFVALIGSFVALFGSFIVLIGSFVVLIGSFPNIDVNYSVMCFKRRRFIILLSS